jgi:uncharacterized protein (TIGR02001 family)
MPSFISLEINMKRSVKALNKQLSGAFIGVVLLSVISSPVLAEVQGNITMASNYIWRGIDRNNTNPAIQGGFDLNFENGLYGGIWGSNVYDSQAANNIEMDLYAGYTRSFGDFGLDLSYIRYEFPKADPDFKELMLQGSYKGLSLAYYHNLSDLGAGASENYLRLKAEVNLPGAVGMTLAVGKNSRDGLEDINDALIGFTKHAGGVKLSLSGTTSNLNHVKDTVSDVETDFVTVSVSKAL